MKQQSSQRGFTLIEIMIVLTISAIMLLGVAKIFDITKRGYFATELQTRMQENARLAMYFISRDFRQAGLMGCRNGLAASAGSPLGTENLLVTTSTASHEDNFLTGSGASTQLNIVTAERVTASPSAWVPSGAIAGTDAITIRGAFSPGRLTTATASGTSISINNSDGFFIPATGTTLDRLLITDCRQLSIGGVATAATNSVTLGTALTGIYPVGSEVFKLDTAVYFIQNNAAGIPGLRRRLSDSPAQEIIEGVENMRILFGQDTNNDARPDEFLPANDAGLNMNNVVALRVAILVRALRNDVDGAFAQSYDLLGTTLNFNDDIRRDVYTMTISFRNSVVGI